MSSILVRNRGTLTNNVGYPLVRPSTLVIPAWCDISLVRSSTIPMYKEIFTIFVYYRFFHKNFPLASKFKVFWSEKFAQRVLNIGYGCVLTAYEYKSITKTKNNVPHICVIYNGKFLVLLSHILLVTWESKLWICFSCLESWNPHHTPILRTLSSITQRKVSRIYIPRTYGIFNWINLIFSY